MRNIVLQALAARVQKNLIPVKRELLQHGALVISAYPRPLKETRSVTQGYRPFSRVAAHNRKILLKKSSKRLQFYECVFISTQQGW